MKLPGFFIVTGTGIRIRKFQKSGFFESCRAISGLSIRTYNDQMSFGGKNSDRHLPEENRRTDSETGDIYCCKVYIKKLVQEIKSLLDSTPNGRIP